MAKAGFRRYSTYRQATAAGIFTNTVFGFLRCYVMLATAGTAGAVAGYRGPQLVAFVWIGQGLIATVGLWGDTELATRIRTGDVVADLLRPIHPVISYLGVDVGRATFASLTRFVAPVVVGLVAFDFYVPHRAATYPLFVVSVGLAVLISFGCRYIVNLATFWLLDGRGPQLAWSLLSTVLGGLYFPLHFLPEPAVTVLWLATPFPSLLQTPLDIACERGTTATGLWHVAVQVAWVAIAFTRARWSSGEPNAGWWYRVAEVGRERWHPYRRMLGAQIRSQASYRTSFVIDTVGGMLVTAMDVVTVFVLFHVTRVLAGFGFHDALLMAAMAGLAFAFADIAVGTIEGLRVYIRTGRLDAVLVRPVGVLSQLTVSDFQLRRIGRIAQGAVLLGVALRLAGVGWSVRNAVLVVASLAAGAVFFGAVFVIGGTVAFWWIDSGEFASGFTYGGRDFTSYPMTVYNPLFRRLFAQGLGFAFVAYYPALALLRRADPLGLPTWVGWLSPLIAASAAGIAALVWRVGVRHYRSTGS